MVELVGGGTINPDLHVQHAVLNQTNIAEFYPGVKC
jgi:hypothetical protein